MKNEQPIYSKVTVGELLQFLSGQLLDSSSNRNYKASKRYLIQSRDLAELVAEYIAHTDAQTPHSNS